MILNQIDWIPIVQARVRKLGKYSPYCCETYVTEAAAVIATLTWE